MGWYDYFTDLTSSLTIGSAYADQNDDKSRSPEDLAGNMSDSKSVTSGGMGTAQQRGQGATKGGATTNNPASGTDEESAGEKEANAEEAKKSTAQAGEADAGHKPGDGGEGSGQKGADASGPHGGSVKARSGASQEEKEEGEDDVAEEDDEAEEEEEEEEEPEDLKPKFEEECMRSQKCAPLKHHYDECAERVTQQHEEHGKAHEDCVEEYFHLMHCAAQCAAPKLWKSLR